jgi:hypothetical protein
MRFFSTPTRSFLKNIHITFIMPWDSCGYKDLKGDNYDNSNQQSAISNQQSAIKLNKIL